MDNNRLQIISENFELRYLSQDLKADGETDFKGETSTLTTEERIDFLNEYARRIPRFFDDFSLEEPTVTLEAARKRLEQIKPQPQPQTRKRMILDGWQWIGHKEGKQKNVFSDTEKITIAKQNWRCFLEWTLADNGDYCNTVFSLGKAAVLGFDAEKKPYYITNKQTVAFEKIQGLKKIKVELDFVLRKWNLYFNDELQADFVDFSQMETDEISCVTTLCENRTQLISHIWGVGYHKLEENLFEPFQIETFIDENFADPLDLAGWNQSGYDEKGWQNGILPIVHGGERYAGEDLYLRRKVWLDTTMPYSELYIESLTPGGEIYINGRLAAFIKDECCHKIDVSDYVLQGENLVAVKVYADKVKPDEKMTHTNTDLYTGWFAGRMHLDLLPQIYLEDVFSYTESIKERSAAQKVEVSVKAQSGLSSKLIKDHEVCVSMMPWFPDEGDVCAAKSWKATILPNITETTSGILEVLEPQLWTTKKPWLYKILVQLKDLSGTVVDDYVITTGIRTVSQKGGIFQINDMPELLRAPLLFGARAPMDKIAAWDKCPPAEYYIQEMLMVQGMNGNGIRMSVHDKRMGGINDPRVCEFADQMGLMLVWQTSTWLRVSSATNLDYDQLAVCIRQVRNHCSIVIWQPANHPSWKSWDTVIFVYRMLHQAITALDRSRLISPSADSRRMHPRWDDGLTDFEGNGLDSCDPAWTAEGICRGNMDYILGYGNEWSALRQWPDVETQNLPDYMETTAYIPSYINSKSRAYFNFEHDEIIGQPNWNIHKGKPTYCIKSYEYYYDEGSIGRELSFDEWLTSQAWQALGAYEVICKCRWLDYDGLSWCNLRGGINTGTYQKALIDYYGQPKLAYYIHRMAFQDVLACSGNVDVVYGPHDTIPMIVLNIGKQKNVIVKVEVRAADETVVFVKEFPNIILPQGRGAVTLENMQLPKLPDGLYSFVYTVYSESDTGQ